MRPLLALIVLFSACGVSTLEMSNEERTGLQGPGFKKGEDPAPAVDAGPPPSTSVDAGEPQFPETPADAGTPIPEEPVDAGPPPECEGGTITTCTTSCGSSGRKTCNVNHFGACVPPAESCDNGIDDDCDGRVDHHDTDCTPIVFTCESSDGNGCNGDLGYGDHCSAADNTEGCSATRFHAWCNRRNPEYPDIWDDYVRGWVDSRCDGTVTESGGQYSTWMCVSSSNEEFHCTTPLVLSFDDAPVKFVSSEQRFAFTPGRAVKSDWPSAVTPWLARDVNGNGLIDDGSELFGSNTKVGRGIAKHGFEALAALDGNADGVIDARDPLFASLLVWRDANGDRISQPTELTSLKQEKVTSISLDFSDQPRCDERGNCERQRTTFVWSGRRGAVVDVYLKVSGNQARSARR